MHDCTRVRLAWESRYEGYIVDAGGLLCSFDGQSVYVNIILAI